MAFGDKVRKNIMFFHDLPTTKTGKDCWISIQYRSRNFGINPIIIYHYTSLKEGNYGCYLTEYVRVEDCLRHRD